MIPNKDKPAFTHETANGLTKFEFAFIHIAASLATLEYTSEIQIDIPESAHQLTEELFKKLETKEQDAKK